MPKKVTVEDRLEVSDILARYCWHVDEGEADAWADLWTEDGAFAGIMPEPIRGRDALKMIPIMSLAGGSRHKLVNLIADYGDTDDDMIVRAYNFVTSWLGEPQLACNAVARFHLVRRGDTWKIRSNRVRMLVPPGYPEGRLPNGFPTPANQATTWPPL